MPGKGIMAPRSKRARAAAGVAISIAGVALAAAAFGASQRSAPAPDDGKALVGEARSNSLTVELGSAVGEVKLTKASAPGRPIVVLDPGHGGRDPGASGISGSVSEKSLTLALARELRDTLAERGRVRVAMTRDDDRYLTLRPALPKSLGGSERVPISLSISTARPIRRPEVRPSILFRMLRRTLKPRGSPSGRTKQARACRASRTGRFVECSRTSRCANR